MPVIRMDEENDVNDPSDKKTSVLVKSMASAIQINFEKVKKDNKETAV